MIVFSYPSEDYFNSLYYSQKPNLKMKKKRLYEKPSTEVVELQQRSMLLAGSSLNDPANYPDGGDPFGTPTPARMDDWEF